ncbi:hypothetical protein GCM10027200_36380 [Lentzea nigeriaca]
MIVFTWHSGSGTLGRGEWAGEGTLLREHAESEEHYEFARATMRETFGGRGARLPGHVSRPGRT